MEQNVNNWEICIKDIGGSLCYFCNFTLKLFPNTKLRKEKLAEQDEELKLNLA